VGTAMSDGVGLIKGGPGADEKIGTVYGLLSQFRCVGAPPAQPQTCHFAMTQS